MIRALILLALVGCSPTPRDARVPDAPATARALDVLDYRAPLDPAARSRDEAAAHHLAACRDEPRSCWRGLAIADDAALAESLATATGRSCLAGDEPSCRALASDLRLHLRTAARPLCSAGLAAACFAAATQQDRRSLLQRGCDLGDAASCVELWSLDRDRTPAVIEFRRARALERAVAECVRGFPHSCARIRQLDPAAAPRWLSQLRTEAGLGCRLGLLDECALLTRFTIDHPRLEAFAAAKLCTTRGTHCELLVALHQPSGHFPDPIALRDALEHHCQLGRDRASCSRLAAAYLANQLPEPIRGRGKQLADFLATAPQTAKL